MESADDQNILTLADTIIWVAEERIEAGHDYKNLRSAIHAVSMEVSLKLSLAMSEMKSTM